MIENYINKLILDDCLKVLPNLPDKSIDLLLTDPPYGIANRISEMRTISNEFYDNTKDKNFGFKEWDTFEDTTIENNNSDFNLFTDNWMKEISRVMKDDSVLIIWFDRKKIHRLVNFFEDKGFLERNYLYFVKCNAVPKNGFRSKSWSNACEQAIVLTRGNYHFNYKEGFHSEVWYQPILHGKERVSHASQKPLNIFQDCVNWWSFENDVVLDIFAGSGTTAVACKKLNRKYICIEKDEEYYKLTKQRIESLAKQIEDDMFEE